MLVRLAEASQIAALRAELAEERERNRRLEAQLRNLADHDPVTDLLNRRCVERELEEHMTRCLRYGPEGALMLIGLDGLDEVAVALGQQESDEAIAAVADSLTDCLRSTDVLGRLGPDELAVLLPRATPAGVAVVAEALVKVVQGTGTGHVRPGTLVASIGVAPVATTPGDVALLLARAGQAMATTRGQGGGGWGLARSDEVDPSGTSYRGRVVTMVVVQIPSEEPT